MSLTLAHTDTKALFCDGSLFEKLGPVTKLKNLAAWSKHAPVMASKKFPNAAQTHCVTAPFAPLAQRVVPSAIAPIIAPPISIPVIPNPFSFFRNFKTDEK